MEYLCKKSGNDFSELIYIICTCITLQITQYKITRSPIKNVYKKKGVKMLALKDKNRFLIQCTC